MDKLTLISVVLWGEEANTVARKLGLKNVDEITDVNTKVQFRKASVEGRSKIVITMDI